MESSDERTIGELMRDLRDQVTLLLRQEVELVRAELSETAAAGVRHGMTVIVAVAAAYAAVLVLLAAAVMGLWAALASAGMTPLTAAWLAPLIIGVVVAAAALLLLRHGLTSLRNLHVAPSKTVESLRAHGEWLQGKVSR